jgi:hypothetical protein
VASWSIATPSFVRWDPASSLDMLVLATSGTLNPRPRTILGGHHRD